MANIDHRDESRDIGALLAASLKGMLFGIAAALLLSLALTAAALAFADPNSVIGAFAYTALGIGAMICGLAAVRADLSHSLTAALIGGGGYVLVLWLVSLIMRNGGETVPLLWTLIAYAACVIASLIGGLLSRGRRVHIGEGKKSPAALVRRRLGAKR